MAIEYVSYESKSRPSDGFFYVQNWIIKSVWWTPPMKRVYTQNLSYLIETRRFSSMSHFEIYNMLADKLSPKP
jgi:hypothetical protein